jgi:hypothetical protein
MFLVVPAIGVVAATWRPVLSLLGRHAPVDGSASVPGPSVDTSAQLPRPIG